jgi:cold shock CspA family protein
LIWLLCQEVIFTLETIYPFDADHSNFFHQNRKSYMADSYNKKEREKKKAKRKKEKRERREQRKQEDSSPPEFMYVDEFGNLTTTPPDPSQKRKIKAEDIDVSTPKQDKSVSMDPVKNGKVKFFNEEKGYGFIIERDTQNSYFVHIDSLIDPIQDNDQVSFEVGMGPKGPIAIEVKLS